MRRYQSIGYSRNGGCSEYVAVYNATLNQNIFRLPDNMSYQEGAAVEPLTGCLEWALLAKPQKRDTGVVIGLGTIGLLMTQVLKNKISRVVVSEVSPARLKTAAELGVDCVIDASKEDPIKKIMEVAGVGRSRSGRGGGRADFVMECSGSGIALQQALEMTRAGGRVVLVGLFEHPVTIDPNLIIFKDLKLVSPQTHREIPQSQLVLNAIEEISSGKVRIAPLVSHEFALDSVKEAYEMQCKSAESVKVMLKP